MVKRLGVVFLMAGCVTQTPELEGQWEIETDRLSFNAPIQGEERRSVDVVNRSNDVLRLVIHEPILVGDCPENPFEPSITRLDIAPRGRAGVALFHRPRVWTTETCHAQLVITATGDWDAKPPVLLYGAPRDVDNDGDCVPASVDCDDRPPIGDGVGGILDPRGRDVHPAYATATPTAECPETAIAAAEERCNGVDDDCDGDLDADDVDSRPPEARELWLDRDLDGFPGDVVAGWRCASKPGELPPPVDPTGWDCQDLVPTVFPGAIEAVADGVDANCDDLEDCWPDADGDSYGAQSQDRIQRGLDTPVMVVQVAMSVDPLCTGVDAGTGAPTGVSPRGGDCDDLAAAVNTGAVERCDPGGPVDDDCDGFADDADNNGFVDGERRGWRDDDGDGHGAGEAVWSCDPSAFGLVLTDDDCEPTLGGIFPGAVERCNRLDDDCDRLADELDLDTPPADQQTFFADRDDDGFADPAAGSLRCFPGAGELVAGVWDCDDRDARSFPGAPEDVASPVDRDCDGQAQCWRDDDGDQRGAESQLSIDLGLDQPVAPIAEPRDPLVAVCSGAGTAARGGDCDDAAPTAFLGAREVCDAANVDEDCDGFADDDDSEGELPGAGAWWADVDADCFGDPATELRTCDGLPPGEVDLSATCAAGAQPAGPGWVRDATDCGPRLDGVFPGAPERCNGLDDDCDGVVDGSTGGAPPVDAVVWTIDLDGDGQGAAAAFDVTTGEIVIACESPGDRYVRNALDCDDNDDRVRTGAPEVVGDAVDEDCNGFIQCFADGDGDDVGSAVEVTVPAPDDCVGTGTATRSGDCNDGRADVSPEAVERCDGVDNDCDSLVDDADASVDRGTDPSIWWRPDVDGDGWGAGELRAWCAPPAGALRAFDAGGAPLPIDCDPDDPRVHPGAPEIAVDGVDQDCDLADLCFIDADQDGFGGAGRAVAGSCAEPGFSFVVGDCDDADPAISPAARELCAPGDEDCDGRMEDADDDVLDPSTWYADLDDDGYGDPGRQREACAAPAGHAAVAGDCDDTRDEASPAGVEACGLAGLDEDCDGLADDDDVDLPFDDSTRRPFRPDLDADGFADAAAADVLRCAPTGRLIPVDGLGPADLDCDDRASAVRPGADEVPTNGRDDDCDGYEICHEDQDADGVGGAGFVVVVDPSCSPVVPGGYAPTSTDCDDLDPLIDDRPVVYHVDADQDGFGDPFTTVLICGLDSLPDANRYVDDDQDCDDSDPRRTPAAAEVCDPAGVDEDCDFLVDDDDVLLGPVLDVGSDPASVFDDKRPFFVDGDQDGYGAGAAVLRCDLALGFAVTSTDCADDRRAVFPGAPGEVPGDGVDQDCDRCERCFEDLDDDGFGSEAERVMHGVVCDAAAPMWTCGAVPVPIDVSPESGDCDDADPLATTGASLWFYDLDADSFGGVALPPLVSCEDPSDAVRFARTPTDCDDQNAAIGRPLEWWPDDDGDGFGDGGRTVRACPLPDGGAPAGTASTALDEDCDDANSVVFPGAPEQCNTRDDDCDPGTPVDFGVTLDCFVDGDGDGFGDQPGVSGVCVCPPGESAQGGDTEDGDDTRWPGAPETCDGVDDDLDGFIDEGADCGPSVELTVLAGRTFAVFNGTVQQGNLVAGCASVGGVGGYRPVVLADRCEECALEAAKPAGWTLWLGYVSDPPCAAGGGGPFVYLVSGACVPGDDYVVERAAAGGGPGLGVYFSASNVDWAVGLAGAPRGAVCEAVGNVACTCASSPTDDCAVVEVACAL